MSKMTSQKLRNLPLSAPSVQGWFHLRKTWIVILKSRRNFEGRGTRQTRQCDGDKRRWDLVVQSVQMIDSIQSSPQTCDVVGSSTCVVACSGAKLMGCALLGTRNRATSWCRARGSYPSRSGVPHPLPKPDVINRIHERVPHDA